MEDFSVDSLIAKLSGNKRPIAELLKEKQARYDEYNKAKEAGDYNGESELGSTTAERRADDEERAGEGMDEGNVGHDENMTQKILNFLKKRKLRPVGQERGSPISMKNVPEASPYEQPPASDAEVQAKKRAQMQQSPGDQSAIQGNI